MIRMTRGATSVETINVMNSLKAMKLEDNVELPCYMIPHGLNPRFYSRQREADEIKDHLDPQCGQDKPRVMAIHGLGGVGKTQLALHYANTSLKLYQAIAWIPAETPIKMTQALSDFAKKLGLPRKDDGEDDYQASLKVKDWLNTMEQPFLLIFDNVEEIDILLQVWPANSQSSILITTRSPSVASKRASHLMHLESFTAESGLNVLESLTGITATDENDLEAARHICHLLGGIPLAIVQISEFIRDRSYSYEEFIPIYQKSSARIYATSKIPLEYSHTLSTVWELSIERLPQIARTLQNLLAFFDPDRIEERLLINQKSSLADDQLEFLFDDFEYIKLCYSLTKSD